MNMDKIVYIFNVEMTEHVKAKAKIVLVIT